jgi:hypothetical protein
VLESGGFKLALVRKGRKRPGMHGRAVRTADLPLCLVSPAGPLERLVLFYLSKIAKKSRRPVKTVSGGPYSLPKRSDWRTPRRRQRGIGLHAGGLVDDGNDGLRAVRMLGALLHAAQLSALRSGPIRPSAARPVLRYRLVPVLAEVQSVLPAVRDASAVSAGRVRTCLSAAVFRAAGQSVCRLPAASLLRFERAGRSLSLTGSTNPAGLALELAAR